MIEEILNAEREKMLLMYPMHVLQERLKKSRNEHTLLKIVKNMSLSDLKSTGCKNFKDHINSIVDMIREKVDDEEYLKMCSVTRQQVEDTGLLRGAGLFHLFMQ